MTNEELEQDIISHWKNEDFNKIRILFREYLSGEGMGSKYLSELAYLFGVNEESDGFSSWWGELNDSSYAKHIKIKYEP